MRTSASGYSSMNVAFRFVPLGMSGDRPQAPPECLLGRIVLRCAGFPGSGIAWLCGLQSKALRSLQPVYGRVFCAPLPQRGRHYAWLSIFPV